LVDRVLQLIREARGRPIPAEEMAERLGYSVRHIQRVFMDATGQSPTEYAPRLRIEEAANRLSAGTEPVKIVANEARYETESSFCHQFRRHFATTPSEFRELNHGADNLLPGYDALPGGPLHGRRVEVGVYVGPDLRTTMTYDTPAFRGRIHYDGRQDGPGGWGR
jgi:AraC-like DNA-binding protein